MKKIVFMLLLAGLFVACNKENTNLQGTLPDLKNAIVDLQLKSVSGKIKPLKKGVQIKNGELDVDLDMVKPPYKLQMVINKESLVEFWVFKYGNLNFELNVDKLSEPTIHDSFENDELKRVNETYNTMYLTPLKEQIDWVANNNEQPELDQVAEETLESYKAQIKKAQRLRKKSILKTVRKAPQNPIALALMYDEFENLTSWQKKECLKNTKKYFSDCGVNWQLKN